MMVIIWWMGSKGEFQEMERLKVQVWKVADVETQNDTF